MTLVLFSRRVGGFFMDNFRQYQAKKGPTEKMVYKRFQGHDEQSEL